MSTAGSGSYNRVDFGILNNDAGNLSDGYGNPLNTSITNPGGFAEYLHFAFWQFCGASYLGTNPIGP